MPKTTFFTSPNEFFQLVFNPEIEVQNIWLASEDTVAVVHKNVDEYAEVLANTNSVIAAYTTAHARLKLYSYIEKLGKRVLYFDTDSVIYVSDSTKHGQYEVPIGSFLGEMTNELKDFGDGAYIDEFVSGGPKNYAYRVVVPGKVQKTYVTKVRGITLSHVTSKHVNFKTLRKMVIRFIRNQTQYEINVVTNKIDRKQHTYQIVTRTSIKKFRVVYDKRIPRSDYTTVPYGW